jgi:arachidonate 15-lipoxygenase
VGSISLPPEYGDRSQRQSDIDREARAYKYNEEIGLPLIEAEGPRDVNYPDYKIKLFMQMIRIRYNIQAICERSGLKFQRDKPKGDLQKFLGMLKKGANPLDYFAPDLGFVLDKAANRPSSLDDYTTKVFLDRTPGNQGYATLPEMASKWDDDKTFAYNFVAGSNPALLTRWTDDNRPKDLDFGKFNLSAVPGFDGDDIARAIGEGRVYFVDHSSMKELFANLPDAPAKNATPRTFDGRPSGDYKYIYAPVAAFAVPPGQKALLPIAIQCGPSSEGNQIYTPTDGYSWKMARICMLAAHNNHHEVVSHLGLTHLLVDPVIISMRRHLHPTHPVYALLNPHFEGTAAINIGARTSLIRPERSVDRLIGSKIEMNYPYLKKARLNHSFRDNMPKVRFHKLKTDDSSLLPSYPYREDAIQIWDAIHDWVSAYVKLWYGNEAAVKSDSELQNWANEIHERGQVKDFCGGRGQGIQGASELIDLLTMIIFTAGPQHAAVNFAQGREMLFVPANPLAGYAPEPKGTGHTLQDLLDILPPLDVAVQTWGILTLLAGVNTTRLGDYRGAFAEHKGATEANDAFTQRLKSVEATITQANQQRRAIWGLDYVHLLPSRIPASINI